MSVVLFDVEFVFYFVVVCDFYERWSATTVRDLLGCVCTSKARVELTSERAARVMSLKGGSCTCLP